MWRRADVKIQFKKLRDRGYDGKNLPQLILKSSQDGTPELIKGVASFVRPDRYHVTKFQPIMYQIFGSWSTFHFIHAGDPGQNHPSK